MQKKQNFSIINSDYRALMAKAIGVVLIVSHVNADIQKELDKKYTTKRDDAGLFMQSVSDLNDDEQDSFMLGKSFFTIPWVEAPSATTARDGLGPLFNSNTCVNCHPKNSRASIYNEKGSIARGYVTRISIPSNGSKEHQEMSKYYGFVEEEIYGGQISINGVHGVPFEAKPIITYKNITVTYPDNSTVTLKQPLNGIENKLEDLNYGEMDKRVAITNRLAPSLIGLGFLEQLSDEQILKNQDINDSDRDGISGKANIVYSLEHKDFRVGRYTYKASSPSLIHQSASAALNDMGLTNPLFPNENCTKSQQECLNAPKGDNNRANSSFDLPMRRVEAIAYYLSNLKIPVSEIRSKGGEKLFSKIGCVKCHTPSFTLENSYEIKPFTDLLLHDMGEDLSDGRSEFKATPREWRTAPLWGIGKYVLTSKSEPELLHDGRAKSVEEAILWHGGEATQSKNSFMNLSAKNRKNIINYIKEL